MSVKKVNWKYKGMLFNIIELGMGEKLKELG